MLKIPLLCVVAAVMFSLPCAGLQWDSESVYDGGIGAGDCTLLSDGSSAPKVVYSASGTVRLATRGNLPWDYQTIGSCDYFGGLSSAAMDKAGHIGVAYVDSGGSSDVARFATNASGSWGIEMVATLGWLTDFLAVGFDSTNAAWLAYCDGQFNPSIKVSKRLGYNSWGTPVTISSIGESIAPAIAITADDTIYISFVEATSKTLKVARRPSGGSWTVETVDGAATSPASYTAITIDPSGHPAVAYFGAISGSTMPLKYAVRADSGWQTEQVDSMSSSGGRNCAVAVASDGTPWIAYLDADTSTLSCARKSGGVWATETADSDSLTGYRPSIQVDAGGNPSVAYFDQNDAVVDFASALVPRSLADTKKLRDGILVRCEGLISSTRSTPDSADFTDRHYVQSLDRSMGIMLYYGSDLDQFDRGTYVTVTGVTGRVGGERAILSPVAIPGQTISEPTPLGMSNGALGGGGFSYSAGTQPTGQKGIVGATGLSNIGLLARIWGWVVDTDTSVPATWFKVEDGTGVRAKCLLPSGVQPPTGFVKLTGISSCEDDGSGNLTRLLRIRNSGDMQ